ncbi:TPA: hypothetical protein ACMDP0_004303 [Vibrio parahaemolyticus]|nr:transposase [Vibrio parahaemolyticus]
MTLNVSVIKLSPYSPEPNPIEQVWRWLRPRYLANQSFTDYHDIISKSAMHRIESVLDCSKRITKMHS